MMLAAFLKTGAWRGVSIGTPRADLEAVWGRPSEVSRTRPPIARFGNVEVTYDGEAVSNLALYARDAPPAWWKEVPSESDIPSVDEFIAWLRTAGISSEPVEELAFGAQVARRVMESGAMALFVDSRLHSIQLATARRNGALARGINHQG